MAKTTSSKPAGSIFVARETTRASNGPNCPGKSSQPEIALHAFRLVIFRRPQGSVFRPEPGKHILGKEVLQLPPIGTFQKTWEYRLGGQRQGVSWEFFNHDPTTGVLTISICSLRSVRGPVTGTIESCADRHGKVARN